MSLAFIAAMLFPVLPAHAATNPFGSLECAKARESPVCKSTGGNPISGENGIIRNATRLIATLAAAVAIIIIILAGIRYITSDGDAEAVAKAKRTIILAAVGLVIIALGQALINFVLNRVI
jgi:hypothetical protein